MFEVFMVIGFVVLTVVAIVVQGQMTVKQQERQDELCCEILVGLKQITAHVDQQNTVRNSEKMKND